MTDKVAFNIINDVMLTNDVDLLNHTLKYIPIDLSFQKNAKEILEIINKNKPNDSNIEMIKIVLSKIAEDKLNLDNIDGNIDKLSIEEKKLLFEKIKIDRDYDKMFKMSPEKVFYFVHQSTSLKTLEHVILNIKIRNNGITGRSNLGLLFIYACVIKCAEIIDLLLKYQIPIEYINYGILILVNSNSKDILEKILLTPPDKFNIKIIINKDVEYDDMPLAIACKCQYYDIVKLLMNYYNIHSLLDLNNSDHVEYIQYCFNTACSKGNVYIVGLFLNFLKFPLLELTVCKAFLPAFKNKNYDICNLLLNNLKMVPDIDTIISMLCEIYYSKKNEYSEDDVEKISNIFNSILNNPNFDPSMHKNSMIRILISNSKSGNFGGMYKDLLVKILINKKFKWNYESKFDFGELFIKKPFSIHNYEHYESRDDTKLKVELFAILYNHIKQLDIGPLE
jgi:hypothetical protein